jgi:hypothetical protein
MEFKLNDVSKIKNHDVLSVEMVAIEVIKAKLGDEVFYTSQLVLVLDKEEDQYLNLPLDVWEKTVHDACRVTLKNAMRLFENIANIALVIDPVAGEIVEKLSLDEMYPTWLEVEEVDQPELAKVPENVTLH